MVVLRKSVIRTPEEIGELHTWGWELEERLRPVLEMYLGESLVKTARRFDAVDFVSGKYSVELKSRRANAKSGYSVTSSTYGEWLVPATKILAAEHSPRRTAIFYYFEGDDSLWRIWADEIDWTGVSCRTPWWHTERHFYVPANFWTRVESDDEGIPWDTPDTPDTT